MKISVIMPVYNGGQLLAGALASIFRQSLPPAEILLVDDGSTDGAALSAARDYPSIHYIRQDNAGCAAARNAGLQLASSSWITFLDADDFWEPEALKSHAACLEKTPQAQMIGGLTQVLGPSENGGFVTSSFRRILLCMQAMVFRQEVFSQVGSFNEGFKQSSDLDWFVRAREAGIQIVWHDQLIVNYQHHPSSLTGDKELQRRSTVEIFRQAVHRRREKQAAAASSPATEAKNSPSANLSE